MAEGGYEVPADIAALMREWWQAGSPTLRKVIDIAPESPPKQDRWPRVLRRWAGKRN